MHFAKMHGLGNDYVYLMPSAERDWPELSRRVSGWLVDTLPSRIHEIPGLLQSREIEGQTHLIVLDQDDAFPEVLEKLGAHGIGRVPIGFDRAVNAFLAPEGRTMAPGRTRRS